MFSIFKKKALGKVDYSSLAVDMHSHLLPGIDDGATDVENSEALIKGLQDLGFSRFITTPHILKDLYPNDASTIEPAYQKLTGHLEFINHPVPLHAAAEYFLDHHFSELLDNNIPLRTVSESWVLVEFSFVALSGDYKNQLFQMQLKGYQPILAHPERYSYLGGQKHIYEELKDAGCLFQMNLLSLAGYYGKPNQELAQYLLKKNWIDLVGTDLHHMRHLDALRNSPGVSQTVDELLQAGRLLNPKL